MLMISLCKFFLLIFFLLLVEEIKVNVLGYEIDWRIERRKWIIDGLYCYINKDIVIGY